MSENILVTGDHGFDYDIYLSSDEDNPPPGTPPARIGVSVGGAGIALRVLKAVGARLAEGAQKEPPAPGLAVEFAGRPEGATSPPTAALWQRFKFGKLGKTAREENADVWRVRRSLSLGKGEGDFFRLLQSQEIPEPAPAGFQPQVVLVEDNVGGFRFQIPAWLQGAAAEDTPEQLPEWIVLKTSAPVCHGAFWWALSGPSDVRDRLVVVVSIRDLRSSEIRVSQGISWERTGLDLARELSQSPLLEGLRRARHVIVTLYGEAALWMERVGSGEEEQRNFTLLFDPGYMEGEWSREFCGPEGTAYGFQSTLAASVAGHLAMAGAEGLATSIGNGLRAMRLLRAMGHGADASSAPEFPTQALAAVILENDVAKLPSDLPGLPQTDWSKLGAFGRTLVPASALASDRSTETGAGTSCCGTAKWRILEASDGRPSPDQPLYGLGRRVALLGLEGLKDVPYASFGRLFTADRDEIEALRNIQRLMQDYENNKSETKPLSISVFGPPGAGKSFGIKQMAETALRGKRAFLEFNLSQFENVTDLIGAFHQVRDKVLEGALPIVFWDEFDSQSYRWLQYLLAPMQDGKFQEGQITHPIGRCIFVFAGATSYDLENFGPPEKPWSECEEALKEHKQASTDFRLKKGPDFKSRLHGNLNVLGPNQRQCFHPANPPGEQWVDDPKDVCFPVRRAILLRSWLGLMDPRKKQSRSRLNMDTGLLAALIEVDHYRHGARSMEKIVAPVRQAGGQRGYHRSALPTNEVLEMNVGNLKQFLEIMEQPRTFQQRAWKLAPAIHAAWFDLGDQENEYKVGFQKLPEEGKGDNFAAAVRIPVILGLVGLQLVDKQDKLPAVPDQDVKALLENHLELLAEEEHKGWMEVKFANGWKKGPVLKDKADQKAQRAEGFHHCLVPYADLSEDDKDKDRTSIRNYPAVAALADCKIVARNPAL